MYWLEPVRSVFGSLGIPLVFLGAAMVQYISPMRIFCVVSLCVLMYNVSAGTKKEQESKGLCKGHGCKTKAQTNLDGYCKNVTGSTFPRLTRSFARGEKSSAVCARKIRSY